MTGDDRLLDLGSNATVEGRRLFATYRDRLGAVVLLADATIAVGTPIALHAYAPAWRLIGWSIAVVLTSYGWELVQRLYPRNEAVDGLIRDRTGWVSTLVWAALPWLVYDSLAVGEVAWILTFIVCFAIATDLMYESPTDAPSIDWMLLVYVGSFAVALALGPHVVALGAVAISALSYVIGSRTWVEVNELMIERRLTLERDARTDPLTGLANRTAAVTAIEALIDAGHETVCCAFIDVDDFKHLNDNHGYAIGDAALKAVGTALCEQLPADWTVARFGGDEFVAIGDGPADFQSIVETSITLPGRHRFEIAQSMSIGVTELPADRAEPADLFREAAAALRFAKRLGKHQVLWMTDELRAVERSRAELGGRAGDALDAGEIVPWAQQIVDLASGEPVGMELLARWPQPDGSMVPPTEFVPVIEDQGRGPSLGIMMIRCAVEALAAPELRQRSVFISVNISARHLYHRRLPAEVLELVGRHGIDPQRLVLEITESQHLPSSPIWEQTAEQLRALGIGLAMDDLGTGYATVEQLLAVPFSHVKVDRVLTNALDRPGTPELAAGIAAIADGAGMIAIIEGIETEDQRAAMVAAGYRLGQGFHFHRPEPLTDAITRTARRSVADTGV